MVVFLHLQKMMSPSEAKYDLFNVSSFTQEFICAGVRDNVVGMYNFLKKKGVQVKDKQADSLKISSRKGVVLLCTNSNSSKPFGIIQLKDWNWWDFYHNKRNRSSKPLYYTYNLPSQWHEMLRDGCIWKEMEVFDKPETYEGRKTYLFRKSPREERVLSIAKRCTRCYGDSNNHC